MRSGVFQRSDEPAGYFITYHTFGTWLHGDERGSVDRTHNDPGTPFLPPDEERLHAEARRSSSPAVILTREQRSVIDAAIREVCAFRGWQLHAIHVRTNHLHAAVTCAEAPERVMNQWKSWSTRRLREQGLCDEGMKLWARHGSTQYLWYEAALLAAMNYTIFKQSASEEGGEGGNG